MIDEFSSNPKVILDWFVPITLIFPQDEPPVSSVDVYRCPLWLNEITSDETTSSIAG